MNLDAPAGQAPTAWRSTLGKRRYDRNPRLSEDERRALGHLVRCRARGPRRVGRWSDATHAGLDRLVRPMEDALRATSDAEHLPPSAVHFLLQETHRRQVAIWGWTREEWLSTLGKAGAGNRQDVIAIAYLLMDHRDLHLGLPKFQRRNLARKLFGRAPVDGAVEEIGALVQSWGVGVQAAREYASNALCELLLRTGSPRLEDITPESVRAVASERTTYLIRRGLPLVIRALVALGVLAASPLPALPTREEWLARTAAATADVPREWVSWCQRWFTTSTLTRRSREGVYYSLLKAGRWVGSVHPEAADPRLWTRELAVDFVAAVDQMLVGQWAHPPSTHRYAARLGLPLNARTKAALITSVRTFFRDAQEWGWQERRFDVSRVIGVPKSVAALIGPDPRVIADDVWAKLLWAGLNLTSEDLPHLGFSRCLSYPQEMVRAVVVTWLFAGLRADELGRLRRGCVRWQRDDVIIASTTERLAKNAVCLLDVPAHKTGLPFTKPVDTLVGEAIDAWEAVRPNQPQLLDAKTGEAVDFLFAFRAKRLGAIYVNRTLIPMLCAKANLPRSDARGALTSHRARSTIASQLFNAREPMTLLELQAWLGHRSPESTRHYAKITPTRLAKAYADAGYFDRNLRTVDVLLDQEAIRDGEAARGQPWRFYDLGHGYCTYDFFDQCPHRMACAKCSFYRPKGSSEAQLLEAKANLLHLRQDIPLSDDECAAVDDGLAALDRLCAQLADTPTPAGPTPRELTETLPARGEGKAAFPSPGMVSLPLRELPGS